MPDREDFQDDLTHRHLFSARVVSLFITFTLVLVALAFAELYPSSFSFDPTLAGALRIAILFCGLGAVALRRARFNPARLQDTAALRGRQGLLASLQKTTLIVSALAGLIALMGFIITMQTGNVIDALLPGIAALAVLLFTYPRRTAWERLALMADEMSAGDPSSTKGKIS